MDIFYFTYSPVGIVWNQSPPMTRQSFICQWNPLTLHDQLDSVDEKKAIFYSEQNLPMSVFGSIKDKEGSILYCGWLVLEGKKWKVRHVDVIPIQKS